MNIADLKDDLLSFIQNTKIFEEREIIEVKKIAEYILNEFVNKKEKIYLQSNISYFDLKGGIEKTDYIIIGARSSVGKTTFALNNIISCLDNNETIGFFTLETDKEKITSLLVCIKAGIEEWRFRTNNLETIFQKEQLQNAFAWIQEKKLYIEDSPLNDIESIRQKVRTMVKKYGCQKIFIDYLSYIKLPNKMNIYEGVTAISKELKQLTRLYKVPIFVLAQLNRNSDKEQREPRISDLRDSGQVEQDADIIILLHQDLENSFEEDTVKLKCIIGKWRNGKTGYYVQNFDKKLRKIT